MRNQPPCIAWAEKLALRREDLSPADRAALDAHLQTCSACEAAQEDYHFLDSRLRALPLSTLKPFPRLSAQTFARDTAAIDAPEKVSANGAGSLSRVSLPARRRPVRGLTSTLQRAISVALVATLILALVTIFGIQIVGRTGSHATGSMILSY
ncbi:MAG: anti-sigma factor family protein, partial [Ktedonobacteraceae bacterium]